MPPANRPQSISAQLTLPGLERQQKAAPFDAVQFIHDLMARHVPDAPVPAIKVSRRMLRTLGSFTPTRNQLRLSSRLLALGSEAEQKLVAQHEVAHAIVHHRWPNAAAHGREFRAVCRDLGVDPGRFVNVDHNEWNGKLRYAVECPACGGKVLRRRPVRKARCDCGQGLRPRAWAVVALTENGLKPL